MHVGTRSCGREIGQSHFYWVQLIFSFEVIIICVLIADYELTTANACSFFQLTHTGTQKLTLKFATYTGWGGSNNIWELGQF